MHPTYSNPQSQQASDRKLHAFDCTDTAQIFLNIKFLGSLFDTLCGGEMCIYFVEGT